MIIDLFSMKEHKEGDNVIGFSKGRDATKVGTIGYVTINFNILTRNMEILS